MGRVLLAAGRARVAGRALPGRRALTCRHIYREIYRRLGRDHGATRRYLRFTSVVMGRTGPHWTIEVPLIPQDISRATGRGSGNWGPKPIATHIPYPNMNLNVNNTRPHCPFKTNTPQNFPHVYVLGQLTHAPLG